MTTVGIAIPCYKPHWECIPTLLKNIEQSTCLPDKVVISCSSWDYDGEIDLTEYAFPVHVVYTTDAKNSAQNRNRAAAHLNTDFVSFVDADDRTHPRRLEVVLGILKSNPWIDALYHSYVVSQDYNYTFTEDDATSCILPMERNPRVWTNCKVADLSLHHAHVTIRNHVFQKLKFVEDAWATRMEDGIFARQLIEQGFTIRYVPFRLSLYVPNVK